MDARIWHELEGGGTLLLLDCENAFNSIDRATIIAALERFAPQMLTCFELLYCGPIAPELRVALRRSDGAEEDGAKIVLSQLGCQQGDPLGPLWFALGMTHLLHPPETDSLVGRAAGAPATSAEQRYDSEDEGDGDAEPPAEGPPPDPTKAPPPPHGAYLDDITLKLHPGFGEEACAQVREVTRRLAAGGLKIRLDKCLAVAPRGQHFSPDERQRLRDLHIPYVDASFSEEERGFTIVGVPIGETPNIERHLRGRLQEAARTPDQHRESIFFSTIRISVTNEFFSGDQAGEDDARRQEEGPRHQGEVLRDREHRAHEGSRAEGMMRFATQ